MMRNFFYPINLSHRDQRYHLIAQQMTVFSCLFIFGLAFFFGIYKIPILFHLGIILSIALLFCFYLNYKNKYLISSVIHTLIILVFFGMGISILGWESGLQYPLIAQAIVVQFSTKSSSTFRLFSGFAGIAFFILLANFHLDGTSQFSLPGNKISSLYFFNVLMGILPLVVLLNNFGTTLIRAEDNLELANKENEKLVYSIFPVAIANALKIDKRGIVHRYDNVSILFADLVGFTVLFEELPHQRVVDLLNGLFSKFDDLTDKFKIEKIKTIGDAYMVAAGVPNAEPNHEQVLFSFAKEMLYQVEVFNEGMGTDLKLRIGISSGPVIAGVIGKKKFSYDLWGDTVNIAARMEATGEAGAIQVSPSTYEVLKDDYKFKKIESLDIKGKGKMDVYLWRDENH